MTQVFHRSRKKISQGSIGSYNTPNNCKPETDSQQKKTFHKCSIHVLISNNTSLKRHLQRQESTGHFHVNSKKRWNMFYDGVNNRVQSDRQFTQDLQQWHKSSIEAEKKSHKEALGRTTRQITVNRKQIPNKKKHLSNMFEPCVSIKHHKLATPDAETRENRSLPRQLQRGVQHVLRWCESSSAEQAPAYTRLAAMTQAFHRSWKKISRKEALNLTTRQTTVNRKQIPNKKSPSIYVRPICYSQMSQA